MADDTVLVENLVKVYSGDIRAVDGIDFSVAAGEFFGFLGPNGAGKTTTMKVLSTLLKKTSGRVVVAGHDIDRDAKAVRRSIGFAMQEVGLDDLATGRDFLRLQCVLYGLSNGEAHERAGELLDLVGLASVAKRRVGTYSGGMRRRIDLIAAMMHRPKLLFLDEPTTGLDPQSRIAIWDHLKQLNEQGVTIFLTTQMMDEADRLCRRLAIIDKGKIVAEGSPQSLKAAVGGDVVQLTIGSSDGQSPNGNVQKAEDLLKGRSYVTQVVAEGDCLSVTTADGGGIVPEVVQLLGANQIAVTSLLVNTPTLDDVFLNYTGRSIRDEEASGDESDAVARQWLGLNSGR